MSLTINTHPARQQINAPEFNVTTSLSESGSVQDLRIRATIYIAGQKSGLPVAVLEQAKGLDDWDFFELLKSFTGRGNFPVGGSTLLKQPTRSSMLITSWANFLGSWETFVSSVNEITNAVNSASTALAQTNTFTLATGELISFSMPIALSINNDLEIRLQRSGGSTVYDQIAYANYSTDRPVANKLYYFLAIEDSYTDPTLSFQALNTSTTLAGVFRAHKVTPDTSDPCLYFKVKFEEVYENSSNVTTIGAESSSDTLMFVPATVESDEDFESEFIIDADNKKFLSRINDSLVKFRFGQSMEMRFLFVIDSQHLNTVNDTDQSAPVTSSNIDNTGWAMLIMNDDTIANFTAAVTEVTLAIKSESTFTSETLTIDIESKCYADREVILFIGDLGEETLVFNGKHSLSGQADKVFYKNRNKVRRVTSAYKRKNSILRTLYENQQFRELLHELVYTEKDVWNLDTAFDDGYREVGVLTDAIPLKDGAELIENEIEIEYFE